VPLSCTLSTAPRSTTYTASRCRSSRSRRLPTRRRPRRIGSRTGDRCRTRRQRAPGRTPTRPHREGQLEPHPAPDRESVQTGDRAATKSINTGIATIPSRRGHVREHTRIPADVNASAPSAITVANAPTKAAGAPRRNAGAQSVRDTYRAVEVVDAARCAPDREHERNDQAGRHADVIRRCDPFQLVGHDRSERRRPARRGRRDPWLRRRTHTSPKMLTAAMAVGNAEMISQNAAPTRPGQPVPGPVRASPRAQDGPPRRADENGKAAPRRCSPFRTT